MRSHIIHYTARLLHHPYRDRGLSPFIIMTDCRRLDVLAHIPALPKGAIIIIRDYDHSDRLAYCAAIIDKAHRHGQRVLVGNSPEIAIRLRADGIHLPEYQAQTLPRWHQKHPEWLITVSCHSPPSLLKLRKLGADIVIYSPVFPTLSHPGAPALGALLLRKTIQHYGGAMAIYALGGIHEGNIKLLNNSKLCGIAGIGYTGDL